MATVKVTVPVVTSVAKQVRAADGPATAVMAVTSSDQLNLRPGEQGTEGGRGRAGIAGQVPGERAAGHGHLGR